MRFLNKSYFYVFSWTIFFASACGCDSANSRPPINGKVVLGLNDQLDSSLYRGTVSSDSKPIPGAAIRVYSDEACANEIVVAATISDNNGEFQIPCKILPIIGSQSDPYYLIVSKPGHKSLRSRFRVGPYSPYNKMLISLKEVKE